MDTERDRKELFGLAACLAASGWLVGESVLNFGNPYDMTFMQMLGIAVRNDLQTFVIRYGLALTAMALSCLIFGFFLGQVVKIARRMT